jgi:hypothetical protein
MTVEAQGLDHLKLDNAPVISSPDRVNAYHPYELLRSGRVSIKMLRVSNNDGADLWLRAGDKRKNSILLHRRPVTDGDDVSGSFIFPEPLVTAIVQNLFC